MRLLPSLILMLLATTAPAQRFGEVPDAAQLEREVGDSTADGRDGRWKGFHHDNTPAYEGSYQGGRRAGKWIWFHERSGKTIAQGYFSEGKRDSIWTFNHDNGSLFATGRYAVDLMQGEWRFAHANGAHMATVSYVNGDGSAPGRTGIPRNGRDGPMTSFYDTGDTMDVQIWKSGAINGPFKSFHPNGAPWRAGRYEADKMEGLWTEHDEDGTLVQELGYHEGRITGDERSYDAQSGRKVSDVHRENGALIWDRSFDHQGRLYREVMHDRRTGTAWQKQWYLNADQLQSMTWYTGIAPGSDGLAFRDSVQQAWSPKGVLTHEAHYRNGRMHGAYLQNYEDGRPKLRTTYDNGKLRGQETEWHPNGVKAAEGMMVDDEREGPWHVWSEDGRLIEEGSYTAGRKVGEWREEDTRLEDVYGRHAHSINHYYMNGDLAGLSIVFDSNGTKRWEGTMHRKYSLVGMETKWFSNGRVQSRTDHGDGTDSAPCGFHGRVVELRDSLGNELLVNGTGTVRLFYDGFLRSEQHYRSGCRDSIWTSYLNEALIEQVDLHRNGAHIATHSIHYDLGFIGDAPNEAERLYVKLQRERFDALPWRSIAEGMRLALLDGTAQQHLRPKDLLEYQHLVMNSLAHPVREDQGFGALFETEHIEGATLLELGEFKRIDAELLHLDRWMVIEYAGKAIPQWMKEWDEGRPGARYYLIFKLGST